MKFSFAFPATILLFFLQNLLNAQVSISPNSASTAHASAMFDVQSTNKGMLIPRMTTAQRTAIAAPATGLLVFDNTTNSFWFFNGTAWDDMTVGTTPTFIQDTDGDTKIQTEETANENKIRFDLGGTEAFVMTKTVGGLPHLSTVSSNSLFIGDYAGANASIDNSNIGIGSSALSSSVLTGGNNIAIGRYSLLNNSTGFDNTVIGNQALQATNTGYSNTSVGYRAGYANTTGNQNVFIGNYAGNPGSIGGNNNVSCVFIGHNAGSGLSSYTNAVAIGSNATINANNKIRLGNTSVTVIEGQVGFTTSDARFKSNVQNNAPGLAFIQRLRPVTYNFEYSKYSSFLGEKNMDTEALRGRDAKREMGLIAQEVEAAAKASGLDVSNLVHAPESESDNYSVAYGQLVVPLIKAVQEQQAQIEALKKEVAELKTNR